MYDGKNKNPKIQLKRFVGYTIVIVILASFVLGLNIYGFLYTPMSSEFGQVREGEIRWALPDHFLQGETRVIKISLVLDLKRNRSRVLEESPESYRPDLIDTVKASELMAYQLVSSKYNGEPHFLIEPNDFQEQLVDTTGYIGNHWEWTVTALKGGNASLMLKQKLRIPTSEGLKDKMLPSITKDINIKSRLFYQINKFIYDWYHLLLVVVGIIVVRWWLAYFNNLQVLIRVSEKTKHKLKSEISKIDQEKIIKLKTTIDKQIVNSKIEKSIREIIAFSEQNKADELKTQIIRISASFQGNEKEYSMNTISNSDYTVNKSRLTKGLLELMSDIYKFGIR